MECSSNRKTHNGVTHNAIVQPMLDDLFSDDAAFPPPIHLPASCTQGRPVASFPLLQLLERHKRCTIQRCIYTVPEQKIRVHGGDVVVVSSVNQADVVFGPAVRDLDGVEMTY